MSWMTSWPSNGRPAYREHTTEAAAEAHASELVRSGNASSAVVFEMDSLEGSA